MQPSRQQSGNQKHSDAQQQAPPVSTRQKKKPRIAFGRRVGVAVARKPQDADPSADSQAAAHPDAVATRALPSSTAGADSNPPVSRLEAIVQASSAVPVSSWHAPAASAKAYGRLAEAAPAQHAAPPAEVQQPAALAAPQAGEGLLFTSTATPACVRSAPGLAAAQGQQSTGAHLHLEGAGTAEDGWQGPYNHAVYADEGFEHASANSPAVHTALHVATNAAGAVTTPDGCNPAAVSTAPGYHFPASSECPSVARMSNVGLQKQYDTLLTDLAAQQKQQRHLQILTMRRSRLLDQQRPAASATEIDHGTQADPSSANVSGSASVIQSVQTGPPRADASTSPMAATATSGTCPASQVVVLPDDPFNQQLPQHLQDLNQLPEQLHELNQLPQQLPQHLQDLNGLSPLPQQLPQHLHKQSQAQQWKPEHASEPSQLHNARSQDLAASQPSFMQPASVSSAQITHYVPSAAAAQQQSMSQQHQASAEGQLRPVAESPHSGAESALSSPAASFAPPGATLQASAMEGPADRVNHQAHESQGTGDAKQPLDKELLRASLAEWLADAVASKLWSEFEKQRLAAAPIGAPGNTSSSCSTKLPGRC